MTNPWLPWQYPHNMGGAAITGAFVIAGLGAFYLLLGRHVEFARTSLRIGVVAGLVLCVLQIFPTGDRHAHDVAHHQPAGFAAMEGMFETQEGAPLVIIGNPNVEERELESAIEMPKLLSFLTSRRWDERLTGLNDIPEDRWPDSVPLVYYAYHIMVGLGTILLAIAAVAAFLLWRGRLFRSRAALWALMLAWPFTYIANIAGWTTAETARQPWVVYGLLRTEDGASPAESVPSGTRALHAARVRGPVRPARAAVRAADGADRDRRPRGPRADHHVERGRRALGGRMETMWFGFLAFMITMYVVLDGFDLGVGALHLLLARTEEEREQATAAIGPVWNGNEVWLIAAGGVLFMIFPKVYAAAFSGLYFGLILALWLLVGRGLGLELRHQVDNPLWREACDAVFGLASAGLAFVFGVALGNVVRGVPLGPDGYFHLALFDDPQLVRAADRRVRGRGAVHARRELPRLPGRRCAGRAGTPLGTERCCGRRWRSSSPSSFPTYAVREEMLTNLVDDPWRLVFPVLARRRADRALRLPATRAVGACVRRVVACSSSVSSRRPPPACTRTSCPPARAPPDRSPSTTRSRATPCCTPR